MAEDLSPTLRRRELGARFRDLRLSRSLTLEDVASELLCSPAKISRIETGSRSVSQRDVRDLCRIYGIDDTEVSDHLAQLAQEGKSRAWWQNYPELADSYATYIGLEEAASTISELNLTAIPGLLQTERYTRNLIDEMNPSSEDDAEQRVAVRLRRQRRLASRNPPELKVVIDESVLWRVIGDESVMSEQRRALHEAAQRPHVDLRVVPFRGGAYPGLNASFIILEFDNPIIADTVYVESLVGTAFYTRSTDLDRFRDTFAQVCDIALDADDSLNLIDDVEKRQR